METGAFCLVRTQEIIMKLWLNSYQPIFLVTSVEKPALIQLCQWRQNPDYCFTG